VADSDLFADELALDEVPDIDEPYDVLRLDELHPLVVGAAQNGWEANDFHEAVIAAWTTLRDRLRERLGSDADGIELINLTRSSYRDGLLVVPSGDKVADAHAAHAVAFLMVTTISRLLTICLLAARRFEPSTERSSRTRGSARLRRDMSVKRSIPGSIAFLHPPQ
jgi:hypothetical protein